MPPSLTLVRRLGAAVLCAAALTAPAQAQWTLQTSNTSADLRGIDVAPSPAGTVPGQVAWASGSQGTVLRTTDAGQHWTPCPTPAGAETLDFRGIQALSADTAVVMSSGAGAQSRLYRTTDACQHWTLILNNPDKDGFWDALQIRGREGLLLGDPVDHAFSLWSTTDGGLTWHRDKPTGLSADPARSGAFAASNSSAVLLGDVWERETFVTGGVEGAYFFQCTQRFESHPCARTRLPMASGTAGSGAFSLAMRGVTAVVVGGNYEKPNDSTGTAAYTTDGGQHWTAASTPPHGYRSAVAWDPTRREWIAVGPNGTDISRDNGKTWQALRPASTQATAADSAADPTPNLTADQNWNALSLPFVVGPKGRIGRRADSPETPSPNPTPEHPTPLIH